MTNSPVRFGILAPAYPSMDDSLAAVQRLEALGWDFIDYPDQMVSTHPLGFLQPPVPASDPSLPTGFFTDEWFGSMEMCAAASVLTEKIGITLGVIDPLRRSPALMAQEMLTLTHMSGGRISFAIGSDEAKQFEPYGEKRHKPMTRMVEAIRVMDALWSSGGEPVTRDSEFWPLTNASLPLRLYEGNKPGLLMVGAGKKVIEMAGSYADGWLTYLPGGMLDDLQPLADLIDQIKSVAREHGRDPESLRFNAMFNVVLAEDDETAWQQARHPACGWIAIAAAGINSSQTWENYGYKHPLGDFVWSKDMKADVINKEKIAALSEKVPDIITDAVFIWGGPERVAKRLQPFIDAGINEVCFMNLGAAADPEYSINWNRQVSDVLKRLDHAPLNLES